MNSDLPKHVLEIDEEGYPLSDGLRISDEDVLKELFFNLKHFLVHEQRSPLISTFGGVPVLINAFDEALVVQSVDDISDTHSRWNFLGGVQYTVKHDEIFEDPWHRLHAIVGTEKIFAVMSRKSQGYFLNHVDLSTIKVQEYFPKNIETLNAKYWSSRYQEKQDRWELGEASPVLKHYGAPPWLKSGSQILVPGAGRGHDAVYLESQGFQVTALDITDDAISEFKRIYPKSRVNYLKEDFFEFSVKNKNRFDAVFEHTIFCAIQPNLREKYIQNLLELLKTEGTYFGVFFKDMWLGGPPFGMTQWQLREFTQKAFRYRLWELAKASPKNRLGLELFAVMQKL